MSHQSGLESLSKLARAIAPVAAAANPLAGVVAGIAAAALKAGADAAGAGRDPVAEIQRILVANAQVDAVIDERQKTLDDKFGPSKG